MKNNLWTIMKKEFDRFFGDRRMVLSVILLPGIMIYVMYSFMGNALSNNFGTDDSYQYQIGVANLPPAVSEIIAASKPPFEFINISPDAADRSSEAWAQSSSKITSKELDLLVIFPGDFDAQVEAYNPAAAAGPAPNVELYYNSTSPESQSAFTTFSQLLDSYESMLANKFDLNRAGQTYDLASDQDTNAQFFSMLLPMLLMTFMFSSCVSVAPESIAGEKERGTIATLLVTPLKRSSLAVGKICSLSVIALLGGLSSFVGTMLSIPKLMGGQIDNMSASVYGISEYAAILAVILSTVLFIVSVISVVSAFAKTVKEASTLVSPLMIIAMLAGISGMFTDGAAQSLALYLIPLYNSAQSLNGIFSFTGNLSQIAVTGVANLIYSGLLVVLLTRMFNSEKIMY